MAALQPDGFPPGLFDAACWTCVCEGVVSHKSEPQLAFSSNIAKPYAVFGVTVTELPMTKLWVLPEVTPDPASAFSEDRAIYHEVVFSTNRNGVGASAIAAHISPVHDVQIAHDRDRWPARTDVVADVLPEHVGERVLIA
jgi:hypothetical protein